MPAFDQTGPQGRGSRTGRGFGRCFMGGSRGYGRGLCRYFGWGTPMSREETIEDLKNYSKALEEELEDVKEELSKLQKSE